MNVWGMMDSTTVQDRDDSDNAPANPQPFQIPQYVNDVFGTVAGAYNDYQRNRQVATQTANSHTLELAKLNAVAGIERSRIAAQAAPAGMGWNPLNMLPGDWFPGGSPRTQTLPNYDSGINPGMIMLVMIIAIAAFIFSRR